ncbi:Por secretion system C-terminal sorting domain-containing protein [Chryseobacterium scophthalmum]|uniref:Por secretion system C-terminal sorting domain-containing protein n=2 Tax=Chryseobacterium scophthalmum TaxID=59733 RepID=A0A1N6ICB0_9FLAO|nr:Por secretion system C-terminal sorting domain-containing protein [Chryseobacterium scophthalmum]
MKKHLLLVSTLAISLMSAQSNDALKRDFERQNRENNAKFDSYVAKRYGADKSPEILKEIEEQRSTLSGFDPSGKPYFLQAEDMDQIKNSNSDFLQNGTITGLTGSFNGENIKFTIFDGGRVFGGHAFFDNLPGRITSKEATTMNYSGHATSVAGFIGARAHTQTLTINGSPRSINFQGIAKNSTMDSYAFRNSVLPGNTATSTVFQKIIAAQPKISNHSYGTNTGWSIETVSGAAALVWNGAFTSPNQSADLQGTYFSSDQNYDQIVYSNPSYIIVKSSGNYFGTGPDLPGGNNAPKYYSDANNNLVAFAATDTLPLTNCSFGYDCISNGSLAKNIIVVGATDIITANNGRYVTASNVIHSDYSSAGPRDDGGIKPDITAVGTSVGSASTAEDTVGSNSLTVGDGTSYSAPVVTGIIGLWTQINKQLFNNNELNAASAKTLMIHSAAEAGNVGPDPLFGWGFIDSKKGAELLVGKSNNTVIFTDETLASGVANSKTIKASGTEPLKVTVSWIDPAFVLPANLTWAQAYNNRSSRLINDLDVRIIDTTTNTVYQPWKLDANSPMTPATKADNTVDNVEQVVLDNPVAGRTYRIEVTNKGTLVNSAGTAAPQNYSIIVTGFNEVLGTKDVANSTNGIVIAPTLTKDVVNILKAPKKSSYTVYDLSGKKLQNGVINSAQETISLSSYTNGIYIIEVKTDKDVISKKVIKE